MAGWLMCQWLGASAVLLLCVPEICALRLDHSQRSELSSRFEEAASLELPLTFVGSPFLLAHKYPVAVGSSNKMQFSIGVSVFVEPLSTPQVLLLDSGSPGTAFCNSMVSSGRKNSSTAQCTAYGNTQPYTAYWFGLSYSGDLSFNTESGVKIDISDTNYAVMQSHQKMPCVLGLDGIMGFTNPTNKMNALSQYFGMSPIQNPSLVFSKSSGCCNTGSSTSEIAQKCSNTTGIQKVQFTPITSTPIFDLMDQKIGSSSDHSVGVYWSGRYNNHSEYAREPNAGTLFLGKAARQNAHTRPGQAIKISFPVLFNSHYVLNVAHVFVDGEPFQTNCLSTTSNKCYVDTGTSQLYLPQTVLDAVQKGSTIEFNITEWPTCIDASDTDYWKPCQDSRLEAFTLKLDAEMVADMQNYGVGIIGTEEKGSTGIVFGLAVFKYFYIVMNTVNTEPIPTSYYTAAGKQVNKTVETGFMEFHPISDWQK